MNDPTDVQNLCNLLVSCFTVRAMGDPCKTNMDCNGTTCHHGSPHCEIHDPSLEHGHCNCHAVASEYTNSRFISGNKRIST